MKRPGWLLLVVAASLALGCPKKSPPVSPIGSKIALPVARSIDGFRLSEGDDVEPRETVPRADASVLSKPETDGVLSRLPPLERKEDLERPFALRDKSTPPPRAGKTIAETFPPKESAAPPGSAPPASAGALRVTRRSPEGDVDLAPFLSVSFSLPLVAVTSHAALAKTPPPVKLTPQPPGEWRWLGAQTVVFQPTKRFPMATDFAVEIPAGTKATTGAALTAGETWSFSTPALKLVGYTPDGGPTNLEPVLFAEFDQEIDPAAVLAATKLVAGVRARALRLATADEIEADKTARLRASKAQPKHWMAFRAQERLPPATSLVVKIGPGAPSAEGPKKTTAEQTFGFTTFGPMEIVEVRCASSAPCPPRTPFAVQMTNPIDAKKFAASMVRVSPDVAGMKVTASGTSILVQGRTKGRTKYKVTIDGAIADAFGQTMGRDAHATVETGPAEAQLFREEGDMSVLDPSSGATLPVYSVNEPSLRVRLYAVQPTDWDAYEKFRHDWDAEAKETKPPGRLVLDTRVAPKGEPDNLAETRVDLGPALSGGFGQVVAIVEPTHAPPKGSGPWARPWLRTWIQVTKLGLDAVFDQDSLVGWTTELATGAPIAGAEVTLLGTRAVASDASGLARIALLADTGGLLYAKKGGDTVILPAEWAGGSYRRTASEDVTSWFVFDDRHMYRPGEEPHVKGWVRRQGMNRGGKVEMTPDVGKTLAWTARDARGAEIAKGETTIDETGGFDLTFKVPTSANLGWATVVFSIIGSALKNETHAHALSFEEFRRPEFEVTAKSSAGPHFVGDHAIATVAATYYAGGGLPNAPVTWTATSRPGTFAPPNRSEYTFGPEAHSPWMWGRAVKSAERGGEATWTSKTGPTGTHRLRVDFDAIERPGPLSIELAASVIDVNRQAWSATTTLLVHPARLYVGLKRPRAFVNAGDDIKVDAIVSDLDGKLAQGARIALRAARLDWDLDGDEWVEKEVDASTCEIDAQAAPVTCALKTKEGGSYRVSATIADEQGRRSLTEMRLWVLGDKMPADRGVARQSIELVLDKASYAAGDVAELLVLAPFAPAEGLLTVQRQGVVKVERFAMASMARTLSLKVDEAWTPGAEVSVRLVGADARRDAAGAPDSKLPKAPAFATGTTRLLVPPRSRELAITVAPRDKAIEPGGTTTIDVEAKDARGEPAAGAQMALIVVDEAVLALSGYKLPNALDAFYTQRTGGAHDVALRGRVLLATPEDLHTANNAPYPAAPDDAQGYAYSAAPPPPAAMPRADAAFMGAPQKGAPSLGLLAQNAAPQMMVRKDFAALALFAAKLTTDARGHAEAAVKVPDSLTRYRVMAVAVHGDDHFGGGEATLTARLPLMVRPSPPRFLNYGDRFEMPVVVQNQTDKAMLVDVVMRAANLKIEPTGRRVSVPANDRVEVRIPAAADKVGTARVQFGAASGRFSDASQQDIVVWTPATTEAFATYGTIDEGSTAQRVAMPEGVAPQFGGLEITTSATALQALTDAVLYLVRYPFECSEQLSSRVVSIAALRDVLAAFQTKDMPAPEALVESVQKDLARLKARQSADGGWSFWPGGETHPWVTVHVAHALVRAKGKGFAVDAAMVNRAKGYLRDVESHISPSWPDDARRALVAYALDVRARMHDADRGRARRLIAEAGGAEKLPLEVNGWLLGVLTGDGASAGELAALRRHLANRVTETAGAAHFTTSYADASYLVLSSDRRADGVILEALIRDQPTSDVIPKLVTGLLAHRKSGRWANTQESAFVLLALDKYFTTYEKATPDFVAKAWLGERFAGQHAFKGRTTERHEVRVPMQALAEYAKGGADVVLQKTGTGRLYYRVGMQYAPADLRPAALDRGFVVTRAYEAIDRPDDVKQDADGTWRVKSGATVRVRVGMVAPARRYHVALVDPLPAGFEPVNPALAVSAHVAQDPKEKGSPMWWWRGTWYEHQNMRDERVEAFASLLWDGVYEYAYVARATTPGEFVVPPPKAEEMYNPETFGRGAGDRVIVE